MRALAGEVTLVAVAAQAPEDTVVMRPGGPGPPRKAIPQDTAESGVSAKISSPLIQRTSGHSSFTAPSAASLAQAAGPARTFDQTRKPPPVGSQRGLLPKGNPESAPRI